MPKIMNEVIFLLDKSLKQQPTKSCGKFFHYTFLSRKSSFRQCHQKTRNTFEVSHRKNLIKFSESHLRFNDESSPASVIKD